MTRLRASTTRQDMLVVLNALVTQSVAVADALQAVHDALVETNLHQPPFVAAVATLQTQITTLRALPTAVQAAITALT